MIGWFRKKSKQENERFAYVTFFDGDVQRLAYRNVQGIHMVYWCSKWRRVSPNGEPHPLFPMIKEWQQETNL